MKKILGIIVSVVCVLITLTVATILMSVFIELVTMPNISFIGMVVLFGLIVMCIGDIICTIIEISND